MPACMPVTWNIGSADSTTLSSWRRASGGSDGGACTLRCVCMQPLGFPVVPEV